MDKTSQKCDDVGYALSKTIEQLLAEHSPLIGLVHGHPCLKSLMLIFMISMFRILQRSRLSSHLNIGIS